MNAWLKAGAHVPVEVQAGGSGWRRDLLSAEQLLRLQLEPDSKGPSEPFLNLCKTLKQRERTSSPPVELYSAKNTACTP